MAWQFVGQHTFVPTDKEVQIGSFDLASGQDTLWVRITQINEPADWPWSYGILSWRNSEGLPLGSIKAYSTRLGEVFRLGNGLAPLDGAGSIWFEPRGFNLGWLKAGFPWELAFEAQSGAGDMTSGYWDRDPVNGAISPKTDGDNLLMGDGDVVTKNLTVHNDAYITHNLYLPPDSNARFDGGIIAKQVPVLWGLVNTDGSLQAGFGCQTSRSAVGTYAVVFNPALASSNYAVLITPNDSSIRLVTAYGKSASGFSVASGSVGPTGGVVGEDCAFSFAILSA